MRFVRQISLAGGHVEPEHGAVENGRHGLGLVATGAMAGLEDPGKGEVTVLADEAALVGRVDFDGLVAGRGELVS